MSDNTFDFEKAYEILHEANAESARGRDTTAAIKLLPSLQEVDLQQDEAKPIVEELDQCFLVPNFIKTGKGRKFLARVFLLQLFRIREFTDVIKRVLQQKQTDATLVGDIAVSAWINANINERANMQSSLLREIIECAILSASPDFTKNCRLFLEPFHSKRRRNELSNALVLLYEPIIFRYLHAANPIVRLNALLLFGVAFPLQSKQFSAERNTTLLNEQIKELNQCLSDESPKVRASAAKCVCRALYEWWEIFQTKQTRSELINFLTENLCFDSSSSTVRTAVIEGIEYLIGRVESIELILPRLPKMGYLLHDPVESVRYQYVKLLITVNPLSNINIFKIVHIDHLIYRLKNDTDKVASAVVQILQPSLFPPPGEKGTERTCNTKRVSRCIFLMERNLKAAERFYNLLPKFVSSDEILCFIRFAYFWVQKTVSGKPPKLPPLKLVDSDAELALPGFSDGNDLERLGYEPYQAIWTIIANLTTILAKKSQSDLEDLKKQTFPDFDASKVKEYLPSGLHSYLFKFLSNFKPSDEEVGLALEYLQSDDSEDWSEALRCLMKWNSLNTFFPNMVNIIENGGDQNDENSESGIELARAIRYLSFIFANKELKKVIIDDDENITRLSNGLDKFLHLLQVKLGLPSISDEEVDEQTVEFANSLPDICYVKAIELIFALKVHISVTALQNDDDDGNDSFNQMIESINSQIFTPLVRGILSVFGPEELQGDNLCFKIFTTLMTLISDMMSLHIYNGDTFYFLLGIYYDCIDSGNGYGDEVKRVAYECLSKIVIIVALDFPDDPNQVHPAKLILSRMVKNATTKIAALSVKESLESLAKNQIKKRCMPWLKDALGYLYVADEIEEEEEENEDNDNDQKKHKKEEEDENDDDQKALRKILRSAISDAILKISEGNPK